MAPKGVKRAAGTAAGGPRKKTNADPLGPKCKEVIAGINKSDALPPSCKEFLTNSVHANLTVFAADRHPYQVQAVEMVSETLHKVKEQMQTALEQAQAAVDDFDREKAARDSALKNAEESLTGLEQRNSSAGAAEEDDKKAVAAAKAEVSSVQAAHWETTNEIQAMNVQKNKVDSTIREIYEPLKTAKACGHDGRRNLNHLEKVFAEIGFEAGLIEALPECLRKEPSERRTFEGVVARHVEEQTLAYIAKTTNAIRDAERKKNELLSGVAAAEAAFADAQEKLKESTSSATAASAALHSAEKDLKVAQGSVAGYGKEMAAASDRLEHAKSALASFTEGPLASFMALKDLAPPPEPAVSEPEAQEEPADEQSAAA